MLSSHMDCLKTNDSTRTAKSVKVSTSSWYTPIAKPPAVTHNPCLCLCKGNIVAKHACVLLGYKNSN